jgi:hypothetical protein
VSNYTENDIRRQRLAEQRDQHAHARIDALQREVAFQLGLILENLPAVTAVRDRSYHLERLMEVFKDADRDVARRLGLPYTSKRGHTVTPP